MNPLLIVVAVVVISPVLVALIGAVRAGAGGSGYDIDACMTAYEVRRAAGQIPDVMTATPEPVP